MEWYEPGEDSYTFLDALKEENIHHQIVLDLGCSTGILSEFLSLNNFVLSVDLNIAALREFNRNSEIKRNLIETDLLRGINQRNINVVVFNPPYVPDFDCPILGGGVLGREVIDRFIEVINTKVFYLLVIEANNPIEITNLIIKRGYNCKILKIRKVLGETIIIIKAQRL